MGRDGVVAQGLLVGGVGVWSRSNMERSLQVSFAKNERIRRNHAQSGAEQ